MKQNTDIRSKKKSYKNISTIRMSKPYEEDELATKIEMEATYERHVASAIEQLRKITATTLLAELVLDDPKAIARVFHGLIGTLESARYLVSFVDNACKALEENNE